jgi:peptidoglycan biosynthesis protein MviN/MurJ (putative lipid II flippase)
MIDLKTIIIILIIHFIADFVLQSSWMAQNKSKSNIALLTHVFVYMIPFLIIGFWYAVLNSVLHFIIDYNTSRLTSKLWSKGEVHYFFVVIGLDQTLHFICLFSTYIILN